MAVYRENLPQIEGGLFLTDAGLETDLIFNHGIEIREFAAHTFGANAAELAEINREAINFIAELRDEFAGNRGPIVLNAVIGPCGDAYAPEAIISADEAARHHAQQIGWLAQTEVDMVSALTFTQSSEAVGIVRAANDVGLPIVVSFTVETDGTFIPRSNWLA